MVSLGETGQAPSLHSKAVTTVVPFRVFLLQDSGGRAFYSSNMRWLPAGIVLLLAAVCLATDTRTCYCAIALLQFRRRARLPRSSAKDLKAARQAFERGLKLEKSRESATQALYEFEEAARLVPQNVEYLTATRDDAATSGRAASGTRKQRPARLAGKWRRWRSSEPR